MTEDLKNDFELAVAAAREAGEIVMKYFGTGNFETWLKRGVEPVTEVDLEANAHLKKTLLKNRPDYGWLSEECADEKDRLEKSRVWIIDPIDGTRAFIRGKKDFAVSVALAEDGKPVLGVLYAPARKEFYSAVRGSGAFLNGEALHVGKRKEVAGMRLQGDRDYFTSKRWTIPWPGMTYAKSQSFALRIAFVAAGRYDAAIAAKPKSEWDIAAAGLILEEAGGIICNQDGGPFLLNQPTTRVHQVVATNPMLKAEILKILKTRKPKSTS